MKWKTFDGTEINIMETTCKAASFCAQIDCTFCVVMVSNPECWPRTAILVSGLLVYLLVTMCYCLFHVLVLIGTALLYGLKLVGLGGWMVDFEDTKAHFPKGNSRHRPTKKKPNAGQKRHTSSDPFQLVTRMSGCGSADTPYSHL